jgi:hypothetical protein
MTTRSNMERSGQLFRPYASSDGGESLAISADNRCRAFRLSRDGSSGARCCTGRQESR